MTMPINLFLVRHGQSEGNLAKRRAEKGDATVFHEDFVRRHSSSYRLTNLGRAQAISAGALLREMTYSTPIDRYITSGYLRAMETAALMNLPEAKWYCDSNLTERDWGELDALAWDEREAKFGEYLKKRDVEPFFWSPPGGESFNQLCLRIFRCLDTLHRECSDKNVIIVAHGEVMWAFRVMIERMSSERFRELHLSKASAQRIYNCQVLHYTRRDPVTQALASRMSHMRMLRPTKNPPLLQDWEPIVRPQYSNTDLIAVVEKQERMLW